MKPTGLWRQDGLREQAGGSTRVMPQFRSVDLSDAGGGARGMLQGDNISRMPRNAEKTGGYYRVGPSRCRIESAISTVTQIPRREEPSSPDRKENIMSDLIAVAFNEKFEAEQVRFDLLQMQQEHLVDLEEAAVVIRDQTGEVRLHHVSHLILPGALSG
jgi:hypothetical protein